ncbi:TIGR03364 family FAD-dependent oxidoreductase [Nocardia cyriacigeorgica]|uniref:TIGR03364 family FAD-dependent oxidoreductase n=1 Tax=Nocardia cyriacigeorgica TaxID=135487 RepID=UPI0018932D4E|nr:TIGR03364 family FAD-dependent oxidoreductase [Nocardia cyriacigeorgica]MBF6097166.1 TIGR03364 family FAD-dependent oxidoreductase [Nocardia cyriacigeorgica]MBF6316537.1 TIGR03364 family FAD-dependent oxidoreductase [Nocardia cyriacigeorgica]MBF6344926.1 TIGR03364 family FAD-dependent oxidoreductase [Nocardia cyriacigeorgica]MBF6517269.1 TIGR03364 family FAD-dependent oxidoreductase [Nocardia cyriacigeorgica]MBF6534854.1 TIGR03364 family FAD-dependent oxidoreductase [Nocardia cyriacigeorgic
MRLVIIGGGILGTAHALAAIGRGHEVVQLEREPEARGATVRNFGLVWVSGRSHAELELTLRSRQLWEEIGGRVPGVGFRPAGSLTLVRTPAELAVAEAAAAGPTAAQRGFELLEPEQVRALNPALRGKFLAGLHCSADAAVESRQALPALRAYMEATGRYTFYAATEARTVEDTSGGAVVRDDLGRTFAADLVLVCAGAAHTGLTRDLVGTLPVRRVRLQMMQTAPLGEPLTTAIADGDSFRYYPGFAGPQVEALEREQSQTATAAEHKMQLLCVQRLHGGLTIGDTHEYTEPFPFDVDEAPYEHLTAVTEELLGRKLPPIVRRWAGVYSQSVDPEAIVTRAAAGAHIWVVTGPGGRGMTLGPALGEDTADLLNL